MMMILKIATNNSNSSNAISAANSPAPVVTLHSITVFAHDMWSLRARQHKQKSTIQTPHNRTFANHQATPRTPNARIAFCNNKHKQTPHAIKFQRGCCTSSATTPYSRVFFVRRQTAQFNAQQPMAPFFVGLSVSASCFSARVWS
jgi:hypothetical protein